jgi:hypothetical protein
MRNLVFTAAILLSAAIHTKANPPVVQSPTASHTYYVSPTGNDNNNGTINAPFANWTKLSSVMSPGDIAYIRGGTYRTAVGAAAWQHCMWQNLNGTESDTIHILAYPGELPVLDLSDFTPSITDPTAVIMRNCNYVHIKGLRITGLKQNPSGDGVSRGFSVENSSNNLIEQIELDHIGGYGYVLANGSNDNVFLNCDAHHMDDRFTNDGSAWGNANGFQSTGGSNATRNTFIGCRAWWISDDGFDLYGVNGEFTFINCWSFWNGYEPGTFTRRGDGDGFKLGPEGSGSLHNSLLRKYDHCVAFENSGSGFDQNNGDMQYQMYNNSSFKNGSYGYMFDYISPAPSQDFKNNLSFLDMNPRRGNETNGSHNSWNLSGNLTSSDFLSISSEGVDGPRQADGSLPRINFLRPSSTSRILDAGMDVGLPYSGDAPEIGAFEQETEQQNQPPVANAGIDQTVRLPLALITLSGSGSDPDGTVTSYNWTKISGPGGGLLSSITSAITTLTSLSVGSFSYELEVTDNSGATARDTVYITIQPALNAAPVANAGNDQSITLPVNSVNLNGTGMDSDGTIQSYTWSQLSGPGTAAIQTPASASTSVNGLMAGVYIFRLTVKDNSGATGSDNVVITVSPQANQAPTANAGSDQTITLPANSVNLNGSGTDPDGNISSYEWVKISGPSGSVLSNQNSATAAVTGMNAGTYQFQLTVTDNSGATASDLVMITVLPAANQAPVVNAGPDMEFSLPTNSVTLSGTASDPDGSVSSTKWRKLTGPTGPVIQNSTWPVTNVNGFIAGIYTYEFRATDNNNAISRDTLKITVYAANQAPSADAGINQVITLPENSVALTGSGTDADGQITGYEWTQVSGPGTANITEATNANTAVTNLEEGTYVFRLTVTDNLHATGSDQVVVTVNPEPNQAPVVSAGSNIVITLPENSAVLEATASDPDGQITGAEWSQISGPATATILSPSELETSIENLQAGIYEFLITVTDNRGASSSSLIQITVLDETPQPNQAPVAHAGADLTIGLPTNFTSLEGTATDTDGTVISYQWRRISGSQSAIISNANTATCTVSNLTQGNYKFELKVTDNDGGIGRDTVVVTVLQAPNQLPVANAGNDFSITLPVNNSVLNGNGSDPDGFVIGYAWTKLSGPSSYTITSPFSRITSIKNLIEGDYQFQLKVTDNRGGTDLDTIVVHVLPLPNQAPIADAGPDQNLVLPQNSTTLSGSGTDTDGFITTYSWSFISGPSTPDIVSPDQSTSLVNNLEAGTYVFSLTVGDDDGATGSNQVIIHVLPADNQAPTANAGADQTVQLPADFAQLTGSGSDADGQIVSYSWRLISGPFGGAITNPLDAQTLIVVLNAGVYTYELTVFDNQGAMGRDTSIVYVLAAPNQPPVVNAGEDIQIQLPVNSVSLSATASDPDGSIVSYGWSQVSGPATANFSNVSQLATNIAGLIEGQYVFVITAWDENLTAGADTLTVTVLPAPENHLPVVSAGPDVVLTLPINSTMLNGSGSDTDGNLVALYWFQLSGPAQATMSGVNTFSPSISNLVEGEYSFVFQVKDNMNGISKDTMFLTVNPAPNIPPVANAGNDQMISLPVNSTTVYGTGTDTDGSVVSYLWEKISGGTATIISASHPATSIQSLTEGIYLFQLTVTDDRGTSRMDTMKITVLPAPNQVPAVNAGNDLSITLPVNTVTVTGTATDPDGTITSVSWSMISGPAAAVIQQPASYSTVINNLVEGLYQFIFSAVDNSGATISDTLTITVLQPHSNQPPVANAGNDINITLPQNTVQLTGSGSDADGTVISYSWNQISGPSTASVLAPTSSVTDISDLTEGIFYFVLTVTDNNGATGSDTISVTVNPVPNQPPVASAGADQTIILPVNSVSLSGTGTDPDGMIISYSWVQLSGPNAVLNSSINQQNIIVQGLTPGVYVFELTVKDDDGEISTDDVSVTVIAAPNQPPFANAGPDTHISLPIDSATISGSGADPEGGVLTYAWQVISTNSYETVTFSDSTLSLNHLKEGNYVLILTVTDDHGLSGSDTAILKVAPAELHSIAKDPVLIILGNPFINSLRAQINWNGTINCEAIVGLYDIKGQKMGELRLISNGGIQPILFDTERLTSGVYFIRMKTGCSKTVSKKLIKL